MNCVSFNDGLILYKEGDDLEANYEVYIIWLRDREKQLNGHFLLNYSGGDIEFDSRRNRSNSITGKEEESGGCGIGYFLKNGDMDYLCDDSFGLKIYTTTRGLADEGKFGLRGFLDVVCINNPVHAFLQLLPFAGQILQHLRKFPKLSSILPTVAELEEKKKKKKPFSRFTVPTISTFDHYFRGPRHTNYLTEEPWKIIPWNEDQDDLPEELRLEWVEQSGKDEGGFAEPPQNYLIEELRVEEVEHSEEEEEIEPEDESKKQTKSFQPTRDILAARIWLKANYQIQPENEIEKRVVFQDYLDNCTQSKVMDHATFGRLLSSVFDAIQGNKGGGRANKPTTYTNLAPISSPDEDDE